MTTQCPECYVVLYCPCPECRKTEPEGIAERNHYTWEDGELVCCPVCGYKNHVDQWMTDDMNRIFKGEKHSV